MEEKRAATVQQAVAAFQTWRVARGMAKNTWKRDAATLSRFCDVVGTKRARAISTEDVDRFFTARSGLSPQTQNLDLSTLRTFFTFLETRAYHPTASALLTDYKKLKYTAPSKRRVPIGEFPVLLDMAERPRDRAAIALGLYLFLRASEIKLLRIGDVSLGAGEVSTAIPKTSDHDQMPICAELDRELRTWLRIYAETAGPLQPDWYLIPNVVPADWKRDASGRMVAVTQERLVVTERIGLPQKVVQRALSKLGWTDTYREGVHTLRRSGARALYDELAASDGHTNAIETVSAMLHHKSFTTTQIYLGLTETRRKRDRLIAGKAMFPSLIGDSVTQMAHKAAR